MLVYFVTIITIALYFWLSVLAFRRWKRSKAIRRFALLLLSTALWVTNGIFQTLVLESPRFDVKLSDFLGKTDFALAAVIAFFMAIFSIHFPRENKKLSLGKEIGLSIPMIALAIGSYLNLYFSAGVINRSPAQYYFGYWIYITILSLYFLGLGLGILIWKMKHSTGIIRHQLIYILGSYGISIVLLLFLSIYNAFKNTTTVTDLWLSNGSLIFITVTAYGVFKHRLLGLRFLIKRGIITAIILSILFFLYTYLVLWLKNSYEYLLISESASTAIAVLIIVVSYPFIHKLVRRFINYLFIPSEELKRQLLVNRVTKYAKLFSQKEIFKAAEELIRQQMNPVSVKGYILGSRGEYSEVYPETDRSPIVTRAHPLLLHLINPDQEGILVKQEIPYLIEELIESDKELLRNIERLMNNLGAEVIALVGTKETAPAFMALGKKKNNSIYTAEEIKYIKTIAIDAAPLVENLFIYQQALQRAGVKIL